MINALRNLFARKSSADEQQFAQIMSMAEMIASTNPEGLHTLIRALLRPLQAKHMLAIAERDDHQAPPELDYLSFFFELNTVAQSSEFYRADKPVVRVDLAKDIILPTPWVRARYAAAFATIGSGKPQGPWRADSNHCIALWWPWRIAFVTGGNHSIATGILSGEGELTATDVFDLTPIFDRVSCDGKSYKETCTGRILGTVDDPRKAAVFEIGRLMVRAGLPLQ